MKCSPYQYRRAGRSDALETVGDEGGHWLLRSDRPDGPITVH